MAKGFNIRAWLGLETRDFQRGLRQAGAQTRTLNKHLRNTGNFLNSIRLAIIGIGIAGMFGTIIDTIRKFETGMARVKVITQANAKEFANLKKVARELGRTTIHSATEVADGMKYLSMAGFSVDEVIAAIPHTLNMATAGMMDMGRAADVSTNLLKGFGYGVESLGAITDVMSHTYRTVNANMEEFYETAVVLGPIFRFFGLGIEDAAVALGFLANNGIKGSKAGRALSMSLNRLIREPGKVEKVLKKLGITINATTLKQEGLIGTFKKIRDAGATVKDISILFGRYWSTLAPFIQATNEEFDDLIGNLQEWQGAGKEIAEEGIGPLERALKILRSEAEELWIELGERGLSKVIVDLTYNLRSLVTWLNKVTSKFNIGKETAAILTTSLAALIGPFAAVVVALINILIHWNSIIKAIEGGINAIIDFINEHDKLQLAVKTLGLSFITTWRSIKMGFTLVFRVLQVIVKSLAKQFEGLGLIISAAFTPWKAWDKVKRGWTLIGEGVIESITGIWETVGDEVKKLQDDMFKDFEKFLLNIVTGKPLGKVDLSKLLSKRPGIKQVGENTFGEQKTGGTPPESENLYVDEARALAEWIKWYQELEEAAEAAYEKHQEYIDGLAEKIQWFKQKSLRDLAHAFRRLAGVIGDALGESVGAWMDFIVTMAEGISDIMKWLKQWQDMQSIQTEVEVWNSANKAAANSAEQVSKIPFGWIMIPAIIATVLGMFAAIPRAKKLAKGGLAFGSTFAQVGEYMGARTNPEVIAPLSKLKEYLGINGGTVRFEIEGNKLVGVLNNQAQRNRRFK